jgi:hypothetical protein
MQWIYAAFSRVTKNPIKNHRYFESYVSFDSDLLFGQFEAVPEIRTGG